MRAGDWLRHHDVAISFVDLRLSTWLFVEEKQVFVSVVDQAVLGIERDLEPCCLLADAHTDHQPSQCLVFHDKIDLLFVTFDLALRVKHQSGRAVTIVIDLDGEVDLGLQIEVKNVASLLSL